MWWLVALGVVGAVVWGLVSLARGNEIVHWSRHLLDQEGDDRG